MLKNLQKKHISLIAGAGLLAFAAGAMISAPEVGKMVGRLLNQGKAQSEYLQEEYRIKSDVLPLVALSPSERAEKLEARAQGARSLDQYRARYLLASDLLEREQARAALNLLEGLEQDYTLLAPHVLLKQAQAQDILGEEGKASDLRQRVLKEYPQDPAAAKALYLIGQVEHQDKAIAEFPSHPLTWEIVRQRLQTNPNQPQLQLLLARYAYDNLAIVPVLDNLMENATLKPQEWDIVATAYWENNVFAKAAAAYTKAVRTPRNLYRMARGLQIDGKREKAIAAYQKLLQAFPDSEETGTALLRLAEMVQLRQDAIPYLDRVIQKFPEQAPEALVTKADILQNLNRKKEAAETLQLLLKNYSQSEEAAEYRWKVALEKAEAQDYQAAWQWAEPIPINNPKSILAPRASFWIGKWATKLGKQEEARQAYEYALSHFPHSYYTWRSAAILGLNVGNFNNVRQLNPEIVPVQRPIPTAGSDAFKELYLLGQDRDAWLQWQTEFQNKMQPTVAEQFTEGLMRLARGENLIGINKIAKLEDREIPSEKAEYEALSRQIAYWQARYPFPYLREIQKWSQQRQLNPLLVTALIRQESRFQPKIRSVADAVGLMQVLPDTAKWIAPQINLDIKTINLENPHDNILLGTWYLDYTHNRYANNSLLAIASYNAGPGNVAKWLQTLPTEDPDQFVEEIPFNETRNYVRQVFGNYWNYLRLYNPEISRLVAQYSTKHPQLPHQ